MILKFQQEITTADKQLSKAVEAKLIHKYHSGPYIQMTNGLTKKPWKKNTFHSNLKNIKYLEVTLTSK